MSKATMVAIVGMVAQAQMYEASCLTLPRIEVGNMEAEDGTPHAVAIQVRTPNQLGEGNADNPRFNDQLPNRVSLLQYGRGQRNDREYAVVKSLTETPQWHKGADARKSPHFDADDIVLLRDDLSPDKHGHVPKYKSADTESCVKVYFDN